MINIYSIYNIDYNIRVYEHYPYMQDQGDNFTVERGRYKLYDDDFQVNFNFNYLCKII